MTDGTGRLLVVEDSPKLAQYVREVLSSYGYTVIGPVDTGEEAVAIALAAAPDLILMDVDLRGVMDGVEAARQIREQRDIPIIYLTAYSGSDLLARAKPTSPMGYLVKPFKTEELYSNIEMALYRHKLEKKLRESEARFAGILATASDAIIGVDADGHICMFNKSAEQMFDYEAAEIMGHSLHQLIGSDQGQVDPQHLLDLTLSPESQFNQPLTLTGRRRNGYIFPVETAVSLFTENNETLYIAVIRDISERKRAEEAMRRYAARLEQSNTLLTALNQVALRLQSTRDLDQVLSTLGNELHRLGITCLLTRTDEKDTTRDRVYYTSLAPAVRAQLAHSLGTDLVGMPVRRSQQPVFGDRSFVAVLTEDVLATMTSVKTNAYASVARVLGLKPDGMIFSLPLRVEAKLFGSLLLWGNDLDESKMPSYQIFASQVAIALENARLLEAERKAREQAETLREVASILSVSLNVEQVLELILRHVERVIAYDTATMMLVADKRVEIVARRAKKHVRTTHRFPDSIPVSGLPGVQEVLEGRRPVFIADTRTDHRWVEMVQDYPIRSWMGVPILAEDKIVGVLNLNKDEPGFYTAHDAALAEAFAGQAKLAIENARLFARTQHHAEELERRVEERTRNLSALYEITAAVGQHWSLEQVLERSLQSALKALDGQAGTIHLKEVNREQPFMSVTMPGSSFEEWLPLTKSVASSAVQAALANDSAQTATGVAPTEKPYVLAATPMRIRGRVLGVLTLFRFSKEQLRADDVALLSSIGDHIAVAIENAELRRQAEQAAVAAERERLARDLHDSVTQQLYSLTLFAEAVREQSRAGGVVEEYVAAIGATAQQALREMRLLLYELRAGTFSHDGLVEALRFRLDAVEQRAGLKTRLVSDLSVQLPAATEEGLYRIAQEALNNVLKHAGASAVVVYIRRQQENVRMGIYDNGRGFDQSINGVGGMGLTTMRERATKLGAKLLVESRPGHGTRVHVITPVNGTTLPDTTVAVEYLQPGGVQ